MKAQFIRECMKKYSFQKFKKVKGSTEFKLLIIHVNECYMDEVLSSTKTIKLNKERYHEAIDDFIDILE